MDLEMELKVVGDSMKAMEVSKQGFTLGRGGGALNSRDFIYNPKILPNRTVCAI